VNPGAATQGLYRFDYGAGAVSDGYFQLTTDLSLHTIQTVKSGGGVPLAFEVNSGERMRIDTAGNVGIGTSAPSDTLHLSKGSALSIILERTGAAPSLARVQNGGNALELQTNGVSGVLFRTGSTPTERLRIDSAGNVGIGTTSPSATMHVLSSGTTFSADVGTAAVFQRNVGTFSGCNVALISGNASTGRLQFGDAEDQNDGEIQYNHVTQSMQFTTAAAERLRIDSAGNVGIGTSSPDHLLHVNAPNGGGISLGDRGKTGAFGIGMTGGGAFDGNTCSIQFSMAGLDIGDVIYRNNQGSHIFQSSSTERLRITSAGNVGIGVVPSAWNSVYRVIQIAGSGTALAGRTDLASNSSLSTNAFRAGTGGNPFVYINTGEATRYDHEAGSHVWLNAPSGTAGNTVSFSERMRIDSAGNVGIGTSAPNANLHVDGSISTGSSAEASTQFGLAQSTTAGLFSLNLSNQALSAEVTVTISASAGYAARTVKYLWYARRATGGSGRNVALIYDQSLGSVNAGVVTVPAITITATNPTGTTEQVNVSFTGGTDPSSCYASVRILTSEAFISSLTAVN
jgi:hypothetical protein